MPCSRLLIDTNVWLDSFFPYRKEHKASFDLLNTARERHMDLLYAVGTIKDVSFLANTGFKESVRKQGGEVDETCAAVARQFAWSCVQNMRRMATAVAADESDIWFAEKYHAVHPDFEDDLVLAAARRCNPDYLVTRDAKLLQHAIVPAISPADLLVLLRELEGI